MDPTQFDRWIFLVNALGIVYDEQSKKILIGRRENDPYIPALSWAFPGGRPEHTEDIEHYLQLEILGKTWLEVTVQDIVFAKTYPEDRSFLSVYYLCTPTWWTLQAGEKFAEVKRIDPADIENYFTTSIHPKVLEFVKSLK